MADYKEKNMKNIRQEFKDKGVFYTPPELAKALIDLVDVEYKTAYDPTCGSGNLLSALDDDVKKFGQELDPEQLEIAKDRLTNFTGYAGDTLIDDGFKNEKFDLILGNPPFSIRYEADKIDVKTDERFKECGTLPPPSKADWAFMMHILNHLSDDGVAVVIEFPGILYRGNKEAIIRQWFVDNNYIDRVVHVPGNTFVDTTISTVILVLKKNKTTTDIIFEDREKNKTRVVSYEEVKDNKYTLSVNNYIEEEIEKEIIDIDEVNKQVANALLMEVKRFLAYREICEEFGDEMYVDYFKEECLKLFAEDDAKQKEKEKLI